MHLFLPFAPDFSCRINCHYNWERKTIIYFSFQIIFHYIGNSVTLGFITMGSFPYNLLLHVLLIWPELKKIICFSCTAVKGTLKGFLVSGLHFGKFDLHELKQFQSLAFHKPVTYKEVVLCTLRLYSSLH